MGVHAAEGGAACGEAVQSSTTSSGSPASASHSAGTTPVKLSTSNSRRLAETDEGNAFIRLLHRVRTVFGMCKKTLPLSSILQVHAREGALNSAATFAYRTHSACVRQSGQLLSDFPGQPFVP
jgi:hypothetical protein